MHVTLKSQVIDKKLERLRSTIGVEGCAVITVEGLPISSALPLDIPTEKVSAMCVAALSVAKQINRELKRGEFDMQIVKGSDGYTIIMSAGPNSVLVTLTERDALLGLVYMEAKKVARELAEILG